MGILGLWSLLQKKGYLPFLHTSSKLPRTPHGTTRVDIAGTFYSTIRWAYSNNFNDTIKAHAILEHQILSLGDKDDLILYLDGQTAKEKENTYLRREERRRQSLHQASEALTSLEQRLVSNRRVKKGHFNKVKKYLRSGFIWTLDDRRSFYQYMQQREWNIVLCPTEADVTIATHCQPSDFVVSRDSDYMVYLNIHTVYRPVGRSKFLVYKKVEALEALDISAKQMLLLGIISRNDYGNNIPSLGIATNHTLAKTIGDQNDAIKMVGLYLKNDQVVCNNSGLLDFTYPINVFCHMRQEPIQDQLPAHDEQSTYSVLRCRLDLVSKQLAQRKLVCEENKNKDRGSTGATVASRTVRKKRPYRYRTFDHPPTSYPKDDTNSKCPTRRCYRPRYSHKERFAPAKQYDPPNIMLQYKWKPWKMLERPELPPRPCNAKTASIRGRLNNATKNALVKALAWEHPTVTIDVGTLRANAKRALSPNDAIHEHVVLSIQRAVREASAVKRCCQELLGRYLESIFEHGSPRRAAQVTDRNQFLLEVDGEILDCLCPRLSNSISGDHDNDEDQEDDTEADGLGDNGNKTQAFLQSVMCFLYSGKLPQNKTSAYKFVRRLQDLGLLTDANQIHWPDNAKFTPNLLVRSVASQLAVEIKKHFKEGCKALSGKLIKLQAKRMLPSVYFFGLRSDQPAIEMFVWYNHMTNNAWRIAPISPIENGFMTFSERELAGFFFKDLILKEELRRLAQSPSEPSVASTPQPSPSHAVHPLESPKPFSQADAMDAWLQGQTPGTLIKHFITDIDMKGLTVRQRGKRGYAAAVQLWSLDDIEKHVNELRTNDFDPLSYLKKGYVPRGSIKTDGFRLQVLAFKIRELQSVRFKRYKGRLPNRLLSTTAGTDYFLTEVRNVVRTEEDVFQYWRCRRSDAGEISYLGIDLGQACVVGACALLPPGKEPKSKRRKKRGRRKRRRGRRGMKKSRRGKKSNATQYPSIQDKENRPRFFNLAVKQKAVSQPTLKHRRWMESQKNASIFGDTERSISAIETSLPPLHGPDANFNDYLMEKHTHKEALYEFYNGANSRFKKHKWDAKRAREEEYRRMTDSLLRMVGGSIGARRKDEDKVAIGIGLGKFSSTTRLSSLHETFQSYFVQKARSLGYIVVGVNEFYTSKKCPSCHGFIAQTESIRRFYCTHCKKFMHRDVMAGHNICNAMRGHLENGERPDYLQPVDINGTYPWKSAQHRPPTGDRGQKRRATMEEEDETENDRGRARKKANGGGRKTRVNVAD